MPIIMQATIPKCSLFYKFTTENMAGNFLNTIQATTEKIAGNFETLFTTEKMKVWSRIIT